MDKVIATNRKALKDYEILEKVEAGIELKGSEVKSIRQGNIDISEGFARIENGEVFLYNTRITQLAQAGYFKVEPERIRKLLLHRRQIIRLYQSLSQKGYTLIPLKVYFNQRGLVKVEIALCKGKKLYDRRQIIKQRETEIRLRKILKRDKGGEKGST
ncbi:MAG: SsrA-binding protein SmpB [Candidatus Omnitrophica bacterium]|nr:SsrA-binding protein SmpB [Candidatus Omnitrophota bacterium]